MSLADEIKKWQEKLDALLQEGQLLQQKAAHLERQNAYLQERLSGRQAQDDGMEALSKLYDEGFHICHAYFAQPREEDCLFCLSFMHKEGSLR
ncbi:MAG: DNA replication initiation control protein YabA [Clostridiales bacterium]|nr:DNA replication initiation control protein YabA [Clostridiales bacterium]